MMKVFRHKIIKLSVFLGLVLFFSQMVLSQENKCEQISLNEILTKFRFNQPKPKSVEETNKELISEIRQKKVNFTLIPADQKKLKEAGANNLLIETIRQNLREYSKEAILLYQKFADNYQSNNVEQIKTALEAAKEFVRKFENDGCYTEQIKYFKDAVPTLDNFDHNPIDRVNPKIKLKYEILKEITEKYKSKDWNEVFALSEKVLEIDPEFTPLIVVLAGVGFDQAKLYGNKSKFNSETVHYAELTIKLLEKDKKSENKYGALDYEYKTKAETLDKMKEILDYIKNQNL